MLTTAEKVGIGIAILAGGTAVYLVTRSDDTPAPAPGSGGAPGATTATTPSTALPAAPPTTSTPPAPPFLINLPNGPGPTKGASVIDIAGDPSGQALIPALPLPTGGGPSVGDYTMPDMSIAEMATSSVYPKSSPGKWVLLVSAGTFPSPAGTDEGAAVRAADANFRKTYDRVIWVPYADMPAATFQAITQNAGEYIALMTHAATPDALSAILAGSSAGA